MAWSVGEYHLSSIHCNSIKFSRPIEYLTFVQKYAARDLEMSKTQHLTFKESIVKKVRLNTRTGINNMVNETNEENLHERIEEWRPF